MQAAHMSHLSRFLDKVNIIKKNTWEHALGREGEYSQALRSKPNFIIFIQKVLRREEGVRNANFSVT